MAIKIKNRQAEKLTRELAKVTGESMATAVREAVRERLERVKSQRGSGLVERLLEIGEDCAVRLKEPFRSGDHGDLLYNENGVPRSHNCDCR